MLDQLPQEILNSIVREVNSPAMTINLDAMADVGLAFSPPRCPCTMPSLQGITQSRHSAPLRRIRVPHR